MLLHDECFVFCLFLCTYIVLSIITNLYVFFLNVEHFDLFVLFGERVLFLLFARVFYGIIVPNNRNIDIKSLIKSLTKKVR